MNVLVVVIIAALFLGLLAVRVPIAVSLALSGVIGIVMVGGSASVVPTVGRLAYSTVADLSLVVIPLFILMGGVASAAGVAQDAFSFMGRIAKKVRGAVPVATVLASAAFSAVTGSSAGTIGALGKS